MSGVPAEQLRVKGASSEVFGIPAYAGGIPVRSANGPIIFGEPEVGEAEIAAIADCIRSGWIGPGRLVEEFERAFATYKGASGAIAVSSGTAALHLAMLAVGIRPGDEVIAPSMTFSPSLHTILNLGATPVLADCRRDTACLDPEDIEHRITARTRAILAVHMCGRCCEMGPIMEVARRYNLKVIEDCAHAIEAVHEGTPSGLLGDIGCFSFYATKNLTTGDGGMVITQNDRLLRRMRRLALQGLTVGVWQRFSQRCNSYRVVAPGLRCAMNDIAAAMGLVQLRSIEERWLKRQRLWRTYLDGLRDLAVTVPAKVSFGSRHAHHLFTVQVESGVSRGALLDALQAENIGCGVHYVPAHEQPYFRRKLSVRRSDLPQASLVGERTLSLPLSTRMTEGDIADVCFALGRILNHSRVAREACV